MPTTLPTEHATIARRNLDGFRKAKESGHDDYVKIKIRADEFYRGKQWSDEDKAALEAVKRPALTLNMILPTINTMLGEQMERRVDVTFKASRGGTENTAFALNAVTRAILDDNKFPDVEEMVFADGLIGGRGYFDVRMNFELNIQGDIAITDEDGVDIVIDPEAKSADPSKWNEVYVSRWMTLDEIEVEYGEEARERVATAGENASNQEAEDVFEYHGASFGGREADNQEDVAERGALQRIRVVERQHFKLAKQLHFVDLQTGDMRPVPHGTDELEAKTVADENGMGLTKLRARRVRMTTTAGQVFIEDDWSIYRTFTIVPFFPYFRRGHPFGVVENLFDPQNLLNKTSSQELHIVNTTANSGWVVQEDSLVDMDTEDLESRGAETGLVLTYKRGYLPPEKITPNSIPTGIDRISQKAAITIRDVSAINSSMLGSGRADQSGRAQDNQVARGQIAMNVVLSNLRKSHTQVALKVLELVQDFYEETRYFKMIDDSMFGSQEDEQVGINELDDDGNILNDVTVGKYTVDVGYAPAGGSAHDIEFNEAKGLREMGIAIPDHFMVQYSNLTKKGELASFLRDSQGFGEQTEEQAEMESFQMEHQIKTMQNDLELQEAEIELKVASASKAMADATSLDGYKQAQMEILKLNQQLDIHRQNISLRIALAARGHQNQGSMNDKRIASQIAMKSMDGITAAKKDKSTPPTKGSK
jgi:hypothetical protein